MITIVVCLALEVFTSNLSRLRQLHWAGPYVDWMHDRFGSRRIWQGPWGVLTALFFPTAFIGLIQMGLSGVWLDLFSLAFGIFILVVCLRYQPTDEQVDHFIEAASGAETERAVHIAEEYVEHIPADEEDLVKQFAQAIMVQANERIFAVILWFALLGPMGAILYRLTWFMQQRLDPVEHDVRGFVEAAHRFFGILNWLPARLMAVGYAIVGSFEDAIHGWRSVYRQEHDDLEELSQEIIIQAGSRAVHLEQYVEDVNTVDAGTVEKYVPEAVNAARGLVLRTMLAWGILVALITVAGWLS